MTTSNSAAPVPIHGDGRHLYRKSALRTYAARTRAEATPDLERELRERRLIAVVIVWCLCGLLLLTIRTQLRFHATIVTIETTPVLVLSRSLASIVGEDGSLVTFDDGDCQACHVSVRGVVPQR